MRDPSRIYPLLNKIGDIWIKNPDLRLGQLIYILINPMAVKSQNEITSVMFNIEDELFEKLIDSYIKDTK